jgi:hypothetical protein
MKSKKNNSLLKRLATGALVVATCATLAGCNRSIIDTKYGLDTALIVGDDTAITMDVKQWRDYEGEQYQLNTKDGLIMLTASFDTDLFYGHSDTYSASNFANQAVSESGEVYDLANESNNSIFNYDLLDTQWRYNKAVTFNGNKALIFNIAKWRDYEGEQLQLVTDDNMVVLLSSYNSKLFYDKQSSTKAEDFAKMYVGSDGQVSTLGEGKDSDSFINYDFIDLNYNFNKIITFKDKTAIILPISEWCDYEGEQLQVKVIGGPTMVTAAYDSILINDTKSPTKAYDIASKISDRVIDYSAGLPSKEGFFNRTIVDFQYGFNNGIISNDNSASSISMRKWCDYEGEQLQVVLPNGDTMLTSSIFLDMLNGGTETINANTLAGDYGEKSITKVDDPLTATGFNKQLLDFEYGFNYALHIENGNVTILPLKGWKDYYNSNGYKSEHISTNPDGTRHKVVTEEDASPNCEQLQLELPDGTVVLTSAYDTILFKTSNIEDYAELFRGKDGVVSNLTSTFGTPTAGGWNFRLFDTKWRFNYAIYNNGQNSQVFDISTWMDYADGEQVQLKFNDGRGILTSYPNTTLVYAQDESKVDAIAKSFAGEELGYGKVYRFK